MVRENNGKKKQSLPTRTYHILPLSTIYTELIKKILYRTEFHCCSPNPA